MFLLILEFDFPDALSAVDVRKRVYEFDGVGHRPFIDLVCRAIKNPIIRALALAKNDRTDDHTKEASGIGYVAEGYKVGVIGEVSIENAIDFPGMDE